MLSVIRISLILLATLTIGSLQASAKESRVAVLDIKPRIKVTKSERQYLTNLIRLTISERLGIDYLVLTNENVMELLPPNKSLEDCEGGCEVDIGRIIGVKYIITSEVLKFGQSLRLFILCHDTKTGRLVGSVVAKAKDLEALESQLTNGVIALSEKLVFYEHKRAKAQVKSDDVKSDTTQVDPDSGFSPSWVIEGSFGGATRRELWDYLDDGYTYGVSVKRRFHPYFQYGLFASYAWYESWGFNFDRYTDRERLQLIPTISTIWKTQYISPFLEVGLGVDFVDEQASFMANTGFTIHITNAFGFGAQAAWIITRTHYLQGTVTLSWTL